MGVDLLALIYGVKNDLIYSVISGQKENSFTNIDGKLWDLKKIFVSGIYTSKSGSKFQIINPVSFLYGDLTKLTTSDYIKFFENAISVKKTVL